MQPHRERYIAILTNGWAHETPVWVGASMVEPASKNFNYSFVVG
jgi:hypothetical protein